MLNKIYSLNPEIAFRLNTESENIAGKAFNSETDMLHEFNEEATAVLNLIDGKKTVKDIISNLAEEYEADEKQIQEDVVNCISELVALKIIQTED